MVITLTSLTRNQWADVFKVGAWVGVSMACAVGLALLSKNEALLASAPVFNLLGVTLKGVLQQEQSLADSHLPTSVYNPVHRIEQNVNPPQA